MKYFAVVLLTLLLIGSGGVVAQDAEAEITIDIDGKFGFEWTANPETDLAGYRIYRSTTSGGYTYGDAYAFAKYPVMVDPISTPHFPGPHVTGTYYFVITAFDSGGFESGPSNEVILHVVNEPPSPPSGCAILKF